MKRYAIFAIILVVLGSCAPSSDENHHRGSLFNKDWLNPAQCDGVFLNEDRANAAYYSRQDRVSERYLRVVAQLEPLLSPVCEGKTGELRVGFEANTLAQLGQRGRPVSKDWATHILPIEILILDKNGAVIHQDYTTAMFVFEPEIDDAVHMVWVSRTYSIEQNPAAEPYRVDVGFVQQPLLPANFNKVPPIDAVARKPR